MEQTVDSSCCYFLLLLHLNNHELPAPWGPNIMHSFTCSSPQCCTCSSTQRIGLFLKLRSNLKNSNKKDWQDRQLLKPFSSCHLYDQRVRQTGQHSVVYIGSVYLKISQLTGIPLTRDDRSSLLPPGAKRIPPSAPVAARMCTSRNNAALLTWCPPPEVHRNPPSNYILERQAVGEADWVPCLTTDVASVVEVPGDGVPQEADYRFRVCSANQYGCSGHVEFPGSVHLGKSPGSPVVDGHSPCSSRGITEASIFTSLSLCCYPFSALSCYPFFCCTFPVNSATRENFLLYRIIISSWVLWLSHVTVNNLPAKIATRLKGMLPHSTQFFSDRAPKFARYYLHYITMCFLQGWPELASRTLFNIDQWNNSKEENCPLSSCKNPLPTTE